MNEAPHIWTRRPKIIEPRDGILLAPRIGGFFKLEAVRPDGRRRVVADWFPNLITDVGLNVPGTSSSWVETCVVGTGNTAPTFGDTALAAQVGSTTNRMDRTGASNQTADRYTYGRTTFRFAAGTATGNLAEIGIKTGSSPVIMFSRALILDGGGVPTTITILPDEALDASYEVRVYPPLTDVVTTMMVGATEHAITIRACEVDSAWDLLGGGLGAPVGWAAGAATNGAVLHDSTSVLGSVTGTPTGTVGGHSSLSTSAYVPNSYVRDFSFSWGLTNGNVAGGAAAVSLSCGTQPSSAGEGTGGLRYQVSLSPVIPKNGTNNLTLNFRQSWARRSI